MHDSFSIDYEHLKELIHRETFRNTAIFADELIIHGNDYDALAEIAMICEHRLIWLAITFVDKASEEKVKAYFETHNFYIPELVNPLRNSKEIVKFAYPSIKGELVKHQMNS